LETLAIIYALRRFRIYVQGGRFRIDTDCNSLTLTLNRIKLSPRIARWAFELLEYDFELVHKSGKLMQHVDALSRNTNIMVVETNSFEDNLIICQAKDEKLKDVRRKLENEEDKMFEMRNGVIYRKSNNGMLLFCVPEEMEEKILYKYHNDKMTQITQRSFKKR